MELVGHSIVRHTHSPPFPQPAHSTISLCSHTTHVLVRDMAELNKDSIQVLSEFLNIARDTIIVVNIPI